MSIKGKIALIFIILLAAALRLWAVGSVPPSPDWDEASLGYNAFSILHTGKDEYGATLPVVLRSFDDYKPALYAYFIVPFIKLFGLNLVSVRLPSILFGVLAVLATFFLVRELIPEKEYGTKAGFLAALILAISPWHIQFSRVAFEACTGMAFNLFTVLFFLKGLKNNKFLLLSALTAALNIHIYQNEKVFTPLLVITLLILNWKKIIKVQKKYLAGAFVIGLIVISPFFFYVAKNRNVFARAAGVSVFADLTPFLKDDVGKISIDTVNRDYLGLVLDNRRFVFLKTVVSGYISHWDLNWLFVNGDLSRHHAPNMGLLYLFELPFLLVGLYSVIFQQKFEKNSKVLIVIWFLLVPIPASITSGVPHAVRTLNFLPLFQIFTAVGILEWFSYMKTHKSLILRTLSVLYSVLIFLNIFYFLDQYFAQLNYYDSLDWQYGYQQVVSQLAGVQNKYAKIVVSNQPYMDQSYIFFLFYLQYSPELYQQESLKSSGGFRENHQFGKFEFRPIHWDLEKKDSKVLYIGKPSDFSLSARPIRTVNFLNGTPDMELVER